MTKICVFDIDGTLADAQHRIHHLKPPPGKKKDWGTFFHLAKDDPVFEHIKFINSLMHHAGVEAWMVTGRPDNFEGETLAWLSDNGIFCDQLLMRPATERKPDYEVKLDLFNKHLKDRKDDIICVFEDRLMVAKMWKDLGLHVCLCGDEWITNDWSK